MGGLPRQGKPLKPGGGSYCGLSEIKDKEPPYIFNGFCGSMRSEFMQPSTEVYYFSVEWGSAKLSWGGTSAAR